jgi:hypothetical protein
VGGEGFSIAVRGVKAVTALVFNCLTQGKSNLCIYIYVYMPPPTLCDVVERARRGFFVIVGKWHPWKFPTCILTNLMFLLNV